MRLIFLLCMTRIVNLFCGWLRPRLFVLFTVLLAAYSCAPVPQPPVRLAPPPPSLQRVAVEDFPRFMDPAQVAPLAHSIEMSLAYLRRLPGDRPVVFGPDTFAVARLVRSLEVFREIIAKNPSTDEFNRILQSQFVVYRATGSSEGHTVLFTGYYEPVLPGSLNATPRFSVPVYSRPNDLVSIDLSLFADDLKGRTIVGRYTGQTVVPYPSRKYIRNRSDFAETAPPIAWLENEFDLFNLQIQGSGRLQLESGKQVNILYDGTNAQPYRSIGRLLIEQGKIPREDMSMQAIRSYLENNPESADAIFNHNPRYVFFRMADDGPLGALGQPLTPMHSIAVDRQFFPLGALAYIETPVARVSARGGIDAWRLHQGFALAQDTGGAIVGPAHVDLFMGHGLQAETAAGHLKHPGTLYFLVLKPDLAP